VAGAWTCVGGWRSVVGAVRTRSAAVAIWLDLLMAKKPQTSPFLLRWSDHIPTGDVQDPLVLGLRGSTRLASRLLYCITTITPRARYFSFIPRCIFDHRERANGQTAGTSTQGDRTGEFVLIADRPVENSGGSRRGRPVVSSLRALRCRLCRCTARALVLAPPGQSRRGRRFSRRRASGRAIRRPL